ncbi:MAG: 23S rRNA (adenine(2503)-C(2))-methyltransferase RlmN [Erysipelotrichaceae bacterium]|jgi:23S rRNA (adenine2503-C2)-methyltransferase|nr:23S rRNA (adenine(2503)-C(2))-methyltransferase RlmN [Erysipelotrichaceae bacterium]
MLTARKELFTSLNFLEWQDYCVSQGAKPYRGSQIFSWIYRKYAVSPQEMSDIAKDFREKLEADFDWQLPEIVQRQVSRDGTIKQLLKLSDGTLVECVLMHYDYGKSVCVSSQVGCNMGCSFCASGQLKKQRDLKSGEMMAQVLSFQRDLAMENQRISHIVVMGIGEPFDNYDEVLDFVKNANDDRGLGIGARHITISTCGIVPMIRRFANEPYQFNLAISLHAPTDALRDQIMPVNKAYPLSELMGVLDEYAALSNRRLTFEYILLKGFNDSPDCVRALAKLLRGRNAYVNLIPYNTVDNNGFQTVDYKSALQFYDAVSKAGVKCTLRQKHGEDIDAACGQLRAFVSGEMKA